MISFLDMSISYCLSWKNENEIFESTLYSLGDIELAGFQEQPGKPLSIVGV